MSASNNNSNQRSVAAHVRSRQRAVAEEFVANQIVRPATSARTLGHANRRKAAVTSTPFGVLPTKASAATAAAAASTEWCGPLAIARQMIAARERAKREQEEADQADDTHHPLDQAIEELEQERKRKEHPSLQWKPNAKKNKNSTSATSWYAKRQRSSHQSRVQIPSLLDLCLQFLVENFEYVDSVGDIGPEIRQKIAAALVAQHKLDGMALQALANVGMESLELSDASGISAEDLCQTLQELLPVGLRYLNLDQCGRCFGAKAVETLLQHPTALVALSIGGAYLWKDEQAARLLGDMPQLSCVDLKACPLLGLQTFQALASVERPLVELALEDLNIDQDTWKALYGAKSLGQLERLKLCRMGGLTDDIVTTLLALTINDGTSHLQALDLSNNYDLTDGTLEGIRLYTSRSLRNLSLCGLGQLSTDALEALFTPVEGTAPPPRLKVLDLSHLDHEAVTDTVLQTALVAAADVREDAKATKYTTGGGMARLFVSGARALTDASLEHLVKYSKTSLEELNVSYCVGLGDQGMGYLIDHCGSQLRSVELWGLAQLTDVFLEGHGRANDPTLVLTGIWMKKSSSRTIQ